MKMLVEMRDTSSEEEFCRRHLPMATKQTGKLSSSNNRFQHRQHQHRRNMSLSLHWLLLLGACFLFMKAHSANHLEEEEDSLVQSGHKTDSRFSPYKTRHHHHNHHHHHHHRPHHSSSSSSSNDDGEERRESGDSRREEHSLNYIYNMDSTNNNQQVPEQLPIVVSSSDNSYVSASPIIITTTTTTAPTKTPMAVEHNQPQPYPFRTTIKHPHPSHSRRLLSTTGSTSISNEISSPIDRTANNWSWPRLWLPAQRGPIIRGNSRSISSISVDSSQSEASSISNKELQLGVGKISSDISTTATTTPRHNFVLSHHQPIKKPGSLISRFEIKLATIINTQESIEAGASFINYTVVTNFDACLVECWITDSCDTAVYQESTIASAAAAATSSSSSESAFSEHNIRHLHSRTKSNSIDSFDNSVYHICFLFECVKSHEFRCQFSPHDNYVSSILMKKVTSARQEDGGDEEQNQVVELGDDSDNNSVVVLSETDNEDNDHVSCDPGLDFKCLLQPAHAKRKKTGCLDTGRRCDGIIDCQDGSDESDCPAQTSTTTDYSIKAPRSISSMGDIQPQRYSFADHQEDGVIFESLKPVIQSRPDEQQVHYSRIINSNHQQGHPINSAKLRHWHDTHIASIKIGEYEEYAKGGLNSAIIATLLGIAITAMLIMIVGHKMRSIRKRLAYKSRRRSLVPEKDLFNNATLTMPI